MSRRDREAKLKAFYGDRYPAVLVSEMGGRKRDRRAMLSKELGSYQKGTFDVSSLIERALGGTYDQLREQGRANYPTLPVGSQHHAEAARRAAERYGFIPSQLLGLGVEGIEALMTGRNTDIPDTLQDLKANLIGGAEGALGRYLPESPGQLPVRAAGQALLSQAPVLNPLASRALLAR